MMLCKHGEQDWNGDAPQCAFDEEGKFREDNWNCFLLSEVRGLMNQHRDEGEGCPWGMCYWDEDNYQGTLYIRCGDNWWNTERHELLGSVVLMDWYKSRGKTDSFKIVVGDTIRDGTEEDALEILKLYKEYHNYSLP